MMGSKKNSLFNRMTRFFRKLVRRDEPQPPERPYADKLVPINRGLRNRNGAVALKEPLPQTNTQATGKRPR
jgi:hypothetical protein